MDRMIHDCRFYCMWCHPSPSKAQCCVFGLKEDSKFPKLNGDIDLGAVRWRESITALNRMCSRVYRTSFFSSINCLGSTVPQSCVCRTEESRKAIFGTRADSGIIITCVLAASRFWERLQVLREQNRVRYSIQIIDISRAVFTFDFFGVSFCYSMCNRIMCNSKDCFF